MNRRESEPEGELDRRRRNVRCLELIDASHRAHARGLKRATRRLVDSAADAAPDTYAVVIGGIRIGAVPHPDRDPQDWAEYIDAQRDALAELEDPEPSR